MSYRSVVLGIVVGCARPPAPAQQPTPLPDDQTRRYTIWLGGARVGTAIEREAWSPGGVELRRTERMSFLRGRTKVELATAIEIDADRQLGAQRVRWSEDGGLEHRSAEATRDADGWHVAGADVTLAPSAVPAELVPLLIRRDGAFAGTVFLPARGFVAGTGRIDAVAPRRLVARLELAGGALVEATIDLDRDGAPARVVDGDGVISLRATEQQAAAPFVAVDLIGATAVPIAGERSVAALVLAVDAPAALPALPGQRARVAARASDGVIVELGRALPGALEPGEPGRDRSAEIRALVTAVRARIRPDLGAAQASPRDAVDATAGDCTTFALAYTALAIERGIATRVVTGLRVDGMRLVRHRWAVSWTGRAWIAVDAAFGAAPAGGDLIGLAIHDADDAGLVAGEAALTRVHAARWR